MADNITSFGESYFNKKATFFNGLDSEEIKSGKITVGGKNNFISGVSTFSANSISVDDGYLNSLKVSGVSTFTGSIDANGDLDVDGHTELDNLNVSGISTFVGIVTSQSNVFVGNNLSVAGNYQQNGNDVRCFQSYAVIRDVKGATTDGGASSATTWHQRTLNNEVDPDGIVTVSSNQFTLTAGSYLIQWATTGYRCRRFASRLNDVTNATDYPGTSMYFDDQDSAANTIASGGESSGSARVTLTASATFRIYSYSEIAIGTNGLGLAHDSTGFNNVFTHVTIFKELEVT